MATAIKNAGENRTRESVTKALRRRAAGRHDLGNGPAGQPAAEAEESIVHVAWTADGKLTEWKPGAANAS